METANLSGVTLEYEVRGSGEPVLLIGGAHIAASYLPLLSQPALADRYRFIRYHKRGLAGGSAHGPTRQHRRPRSGCVKTCSTTWASVAHTSLATRAEDKSLYNWLSTVPKLFTVSSCRSRQ